MPRIRPLTEDGRRKARNAERDNAFRMAIRTWCAINGGTKALADKTGMAYTTLMKRLREPDTMSIKELRQINDVLPTDFKVPGMFIGL